MPELAQLQQVYAEQPVRVVAVGTGSTERLTLLRDEHAGALAVPQATGPWREALEIVAFPETLIVDRDGRIAVRVLGGQDLAGFSALVEGLLHEEPGVGAASAEPAAQETARHGFKARVSGWWVTRRD